MNISTKLREISIYSFKVFFRLHGPFEASIYEIFFGRRPLREERRLKDKITTEDLPIANCVVINNSEHTQTFEKFLKTLSAEYLTASADES